MSCSEKVAAHGEKTAEKIGGIDRNVRLLSVQDAEDSSSIVSVEQKKREFQHQLPQWETPSRRVWSTMPP